MIKKHRVIRELREQHERTEKARKKLDKKVTSTCDKLVTNCKNKRFVFVVAAEQCGDHFFGTDFVFCGHATTNSTNENEQLWKAFEAISKFANEELSKLN